MPMPTFARWAIVIGTIYLLLPLIACLALSTSIWLMSLPMFLGFLFGYPLGLITPVLMRLLWPTVLARLQARPGRTASSGAPPRW